MIKLFPHYLNNTRHKSKEYANPNYESDSYDKETGTWDTKSYENGPFWLIKKQHFINLYIKPKNHSKVRQIAFVKSDTKSSIQAITY